MKIAFVAIYPLHGTGYARIANKITNYLVNIPSVELCYYALYVGNECDMIKDRYIDPKIKMYDSNTIHLQRMLEIEQPDSLFMYMDPLEIVHILESVSKKNIPSKLYLYIDLVYEWERPGYFKILKTYNITQIFTFLDYWKHHFIYDLGFNKNIVTTLPHGVDFNEFVCFPKKEAKKLLGFNSDDFLIINMNRNSPRKKMEITIRAFLDFLVDQSMNPIIKLYLNAHPTSKNNERPHLADIIESECMIRKIDSNLIFDQHIIFKGNFHYRDNKSVNLIYSASDVGITSTSGEGFGLTIVEHAYFNVPQITSEIPQIKETMGTNAFYVKPICKMVSMEITHGYEYYTDSDGYRNHLNYIFNNRNLCINTQDYIKSKYSWENVYKVLDAFFRN